MIATYGVTAVVVAASAFFRGLTGFGFSLFSALLLPSILGVDVAIPLVLLLELATAAIMLRKEWLHTVNGIPEKRFLLIAGLAGAVIGVALIALLPQDATRLAVNVSIVIAALATLVKNPPPWLASRSVGAAIGLLVGALLSAVAVGGPLLVVWLTSAKVSAQQARIVMTLFFGEIAICAVLLRGVFGELPIASIGLALGLLPIAAIGVKAGELAFARIAPPHLRALVTISLIAIAILGSAGALHLI